MSQKRLPKYSRTDESFKALAHRQTTDRSLDIISYLSHYHILPSSLLVRLVEGNEKITRRHLQTLFHKKLINFFVFPRLRNVSEHHYYLDNPAALDLLVEAGWAEPNDLDYERLAHNRRGNYHEAHHNPEERQGQLLFLKHEADISRFHTLLELGCRASDGKAELADWRQGSELWHQVTVPRVKYDNQRDLWGEQRDTETLPHRPDAFFTLHFPKRPAGQQEMHFYYERDRKTTLDRKRIVRKLRAHFHYVVKNRQHETDYGVKRIRAVLFETIDDEWAMHLREVAQHPLSGKGSSLFWFTHSRLFTHGFKNAQNGSLQEKGDFFLTNPQIIFHPIWAAPAEDVLYSLCD